MSVALVASAAVRSRCPYARFCHATVILVNICITGLRPCFSLPDLHLYRVDPCQVCTAKIRCRMGSHWHEVCPAFAGSPLVVFGEELQPTRAGIPVGGNDSRVRRAGAACFYPCCHSALTVVAAFVDATALMLAPVVGHGNFCQPWPFIRMDGCLCALGMVSYPRATLPETLSR